MLDIKAIRLDPETIINGLSKRGMQLEINDFLRIDGLWRSTLQQAEKLREQRNKATQSIAEQKAKGAHVADDDLKAMRTLAQKIKELEHKQKELEEDLQRRLLVLPNIPHSTVPEGTCDGDNCEVKNWGEPRTFTFQPAAHWDLGEKLNILDWQRAGKVTGARFCFYRGLGAMLERALINFMLDLHGQKHGYIEIFPPFIVNADSMTGTGQLPKFAEDVFKLENSDYYLIPTAEVPVTNLYRDEILNEDSLPICHVAYSACFRAEAGAHGRDTRGLIRQHQFNKVELVKFCPPSTSYAELEKLTADAEEVLQLLELPYRVMQLCTGDLGFSAAKTNDLEVWLPSFAGYREISSCSNFEDFQARRANIRYKPSNGGKPKFIHTLNGSGLAVGRTVAAILENYQQEDGSVIVPQVLQSYMAGTKVIS